MRAAVRDRYGPPEVVRVVEVDRPAVRDATCWSGCALVSSGLGRLPLDILRGAHADLGA
jgi:hypothetical protein